MNTTIHIAEQLINVSALKCNGVIDDEFKETPRFLTDDFCVSVYLGETLEETDVSVYNFETEETFNMSFDSSEDRLTNIQNGLSFIESKLN